jgi:hypothetical protein
MLGSSWAAAQLAASQEGLSSMSDDDDVRIVFAFVARDVSIVIWVLEF